MKSRLLRIIGTVGLTLLMSSCAHQAPRLVNMTSDLTRTNPSNIYTITLFLDSEQQITSPRANIVIGGAIYPMYPVPEKNNFLAFDYSIPQGNNHAKYYFEYLDKDGNVIAKSDVQELRLTNLYVSGMESTRAQPGEAISVFGKGFRAEDKVRFNDQPIETRFISDKQLEFDVPALKGGETYGVTLETSGGVVAIGPFRIDYSELRSMPSRLVLLEGQTATIVFTIDKQAPAGGVPLTMSTSVPDILLYDPVTIEAGDRSVNIQVMGGAPGKGELLVKAPAHNRIAIPVEVQNRVAEEGPLVAPSSDGEE